MATLSELLRMSAETLAVQIEEGEFAALAPSARCDLRVLSLNLAAWSDRAATAEMDLGVEAARGRAASFWEWQRRCRETLGTGFGSSLTPPDALRPATDDHARGPALPATPAKRRAR